jgi:hypothetical protein
MAMQHAEGEFDIINWDEQTYQELPQGGKLTRASVVQTFHGGIEGEGSIDYLMAYPREDAATFTGLMHVSASVGGKSGGFVMQVSGTFDEGLAAGKWFVIPGTGTGELTGLKGDGGFGPHGHGSMPYALDYEFEDDASGGA